MKKRKIAILGTKYTSRKKTFREEPLFGERNIDGYCDGHLKEIVYCDLVTHPAFSNESEEYCNSCEKATIRHEIIHAFFNESGLMENSAKFQHGWSQNEEMVDWFALQCPQNTQDFSQTGYFVEKVY